jgi:hypothetical protein
MVRVTEQDALTTPPLATLDYAPPAARPSRRDTVWGVFISIFFANGVGSVFFGFLMMMGQRDDHAGPIAVGMGFITLALGLAGTLYVTRRFQQNQR